MNKNVKSIMTKKEMKLIEGGSFANVKQMSVKQLKSQILEGRQLRDKYEALVELHKGSNRHRYNYENIERAHILRIMVGRCERRFRLLQTENLV